MASLVSKPIAFKRRLKFWRGLAFAYLQRYKIVLIFTLVLALTLSFATYKISSLIFRPNTLTLGYVGYFQLESIPAQVLSLVTEPLISVDESGRPKPALATHWTISEDGKIFVIFLEDGLTWHDSTKVLAKDISIAISNVEINALNNKAIQFRLQSPITSFLLALNKPVFKANSFYGTGEFRIVDIDRVEDSVRRIALVPKKSDLPRVEIKFYTTEEQAINAIKIGEVKSAKVANAQNLYDWPNLKVDTNPDYSESITIFYNNLDPVLSSKELRQALSFAINRDNFDGEDAHSPISPNSWVYNESVKKYEYNPVKSKELLSKSQISAPEITLSTTKDLEDVAESIKKDWESIGVRVTINIRKAIPKDFQALLATNKLSPDPDQYAFWHSTQKKTNITNYRDVKIDKLLEDARSTKEEEKRKELYFDFQKSLVEAAPATFLYHPYKYQVTYKNAQHLIDKLPK